MKTKILMVCLGNICRSPLAEGILQSKLPSKLFTVDSAGTGAWHVGNPPDDRSIEIALKNNIDLSTQRARQFTQKDFQSFDYIYVMDRSNYQNVIKLAKNPQDIHKVKLILNELESSKLLDVPDPYYGGSDGFEHVFDLLNSACTSIAEKLTK